VTIAGRFHPTPFTVDQRSVVCLSGSSVGDEFPRNRGTFQPWPDDSDSPRRVLGKRVGSNRTVPEDALRGWFQRVIISDKTQCASTRGSSWGQSR